MAWGAEENGAPPSGDGILSEGLDAVGLGGVGTPPEGGPENGDPGILAKPEKSPFDKVKTWSVGAGALSTVVTVGGAYVYWRSARRPKGRKKQPNGRAGRLLGIAGISLGLSTLVVSGLVFGASREVEKKVQESAILRALL